MPSIVFKTIKPSKLKSDAFRLEVLSALNSAGKEIKSDFEKTTETWNDKPTFEIVKDFRRSGSNTPAVLVGTDDKIYKFVDEGTKVRHAVMSKDFSPKTTPGVIGSVVGSGGMVYVNKNINRPGIKARGFSIKIQEKWQPRFKRMIEDALSSAAKKSGHKI